MARYDATLQASSPSLQLLDQLLPLELASFFNNVTHEGVPGFYGAPYIFQVLKYGIKA